MITHWMLWDWIIIVYDAVKEIDLEKTSLPQTAGIFAIGVFWGLKQIIKYIFKYYF
jgi:hypothetical protein